MSTFFERLRAALAPDYELLQEVGSGGMGTVYLARHLALNKPVAVKVLRPELVTAVAVERFVREAQILANVSHPHIVPVHNLDEREGLTFYTMDYLDGDTLRSRLEHLGLLGAHVARKVGRS